MCQLEEPNVQISASAPHRPAHPPQKRAERPSNCCGVACNLHHLCALYAAVENSDPYSVRIAFCPRRADGTRTLFEPMRPIVCIEADERELHALTLGEVLGRRFEAVL